jgi:glycosyltransferase involved in cell wall biosynthesis
MVWAHVLVMARSLMLRPKPERALVPYPAPILLYVWSLMPRSLRPRRIVADAFISLYDTVVNDRGLLRPADWRAKLLWRIERRAYGVADTVVVDTSQNAAFYASLFGLPRELFVPVPLATNEHDFVPTSTPARCDTCNVLFIGTLIPLHGISVIVDAARLLAGRKDIRFTIVGTGQDANVMESALSDGVTNITWERDWKASAQLAAHIAQADICLGIFGSGSKAQRVCPYKVYAYASMGRPVMTARTAWLDQAVEEFGEVPFVDVPAADASALASGIVRLADDEVLRGEMAGRAREFYDAMLANRITIARLHAILAGEIES